MSCSIYSDYGTYLKTRSTYQAICDLKKLIEEYNLTKGGTICGDLIIKDGNLTVSDGTTNLQDLVVIGSLTVSGEFVVTDLSLTNLEVSGNTTLNDLTVLGSFNITDLSLDNLDVAQDLNVGGDTILYGGLTVFGTTTKINTANLDVSDNLILLNANVTGPNLLDTGIILNRGDLSNIFIGWDESEDHVTLSYTDSSGYTIGPVPNQGYANLALYGISLNDIQLEGNITISGEIINGGGLVIGSSANMVDEIYVDSLTVSGSTLHIGDCDIGYDGSYLTVSTSVEISGDLVVLGDISNSKLNSYDASINALEATTIDLSGRVAIIDTSVNALESTTSDLSGRVGILDTGLITVNNAVLDLSGRVAVIDSSVNGLENTTTDLSGRVGIVETGLVTVNNTVVDLSGRVAVLDTSVNAIESSIVSISNNYLRLDGSTPMNGTLDMSLNIIDDISAVNIVRADESGLRVNVDGIELLNAGKIPLGITQGYDSVTFKWDFNTKVNVNDYTGVTNVSGQYLINSIPVLTATSLGSGVYDSNLQNVGILNGLQVAGDISSGGNLVLAGDVSNTQLNVIEASINLLETTTTSISNNYLRLDGTTPMQGSIDMSYNDIIDAGVITLTEPTLQGLKVSRTGLEVLKAGGGDSGIKIRHDAVGEWQLETDVNIFAFVDPSLGISTNGKYKINSNTVLNETSLGNGVIDSSLQTFGIIPELNISGVITNAGSIIIGTSNNRIDELYVKTLDVCSNTIHIGDADIGYGGGNVTVSTGLSVSGNLVVLGDISNAGLNTVDTSINLLETTTIDLSGRVAVLDTSVNTLETTIITISNNYLRLDGTTQMVGDLCMNFNNIYDISTMNVVHLVSIADPSNNGLRVSPGYLEVVNTNLDDGITLSYNGLQWVFESGINVNDFSATLPFIHQKIGSYSINSNIVLFETALGSGVVDSSLQTLGTLTSLDVTGDVSINGDVTINNGGSINMKDSSGRNTYVKGSTLNIINIHPVTIPALGISANCDISSILYSNMDNSNSVFNTTTNTINILDNSANFQNSFIEIYANVLLVQGSKTVEYTRVYLESTTDPSYVLRIDTRTLAKDTTSNVTYGPNNIITNIDGVLSHNYRVRVEKSPAATGTAVTFASPFEIVLKQTCLI